MTVPFFSAAFGHEPSPTEGRKRESVQERRGGKVPGASCSCLNVIYCTLRVVGRECWSLSFCVLFCISGLMICAQEAMTFYKCVSLPLRAVNILVNLCFLPTPVFLNSSPPFLSSAVTTGRQCSPTPEIEEIIKKEHKHTQWLERIKCLCRSTL